MRWKDILWTNGKYQISDTGALKRFIDSRHSRIVKPSHAGRGYLIVRIYLNGWCKTEYVHTLVLESFVGPRPEGLIGNHKDGDKENCSVNNLEWTTYGENNQHALDHGLRKPRSGPAHQNYGKTTKQIFGKDFNGANNPFYGRAHTDEAKTKLASYSGERASKAQLTNEQARTIETEYTNGTTKIQLSDKYGVSWFVIHGIVKGKTYKDKTI